MEMEAAWLLVCNLISVAAKAGGLLCGDLGGEICSAMQWCQNGIGIVDVSQRNGGLMTGTRNVARTF